MDWDKLKQFYYVAKVGNFTRAGERLNISQSALSRSVRSLEDALHAKLFQRNARGVILTQQGEILFDHVSMMMDSVHRAQNTIREEGSEPQGSLKIAATYGVAMLYIAPHIPDFVKKFPKIRMILLGTDIAPDLDLCESDVVIHPFMPNHPNYIQRYLVTMQLKVYASPGYLKKFGTPRSVGDLDSHQLIGYGDHTNHPYHCSNWLLTTGLPEGKMREPYVQANATQTRVMMAQSDMGIITVPGEHPGIGESGLVEINLGVQGPTIDLYYIYSKQLKNSKRILGFRDYLEEKMKNKRIKNCA
ncbi:MAG: LysR family transcriptional regulator [Candidatus Nucleicultricaceae bacterium]